MDTVFKEITFKQISIRYAIPPKSVPIDEYPEHVSKLNAPIQENVYVPDAAKRFNALISDHCKMLYETYHILVKFNYSISAHVSGGPGDYIIDFVVEEGENLIALNPRQRHQYISIDPKITDADLRRLLARVVSILAFSSEFVVI